MKRGGGGGEEGGEGGGEEEGGREGGGGRTRRPDLASVETLLPTHRLAPVHCTYCLV